MKGPSAVGPAQTARKPMARALLRQPAQATAPHMGAWRQCREVRCPRAAPRVSHSVAPPPRLCRKLSKRATTAAGGLWAHRPDAGWREGGASAGRGPDGPTPTPMGGHTLPARPDSEPSAMVAARSHQPPHRCRHGSGARENGHRPYHDPRPRRNGAAMTGNPHRSLVASLPCTRKTAHQQPPTLLSGGAS